MSAEGGRLAVVFTMLASLVDFSSYASNNRSAVSLNGSDLNTCTTTSPCRSFATALANTVSGGEVIALDSAGYGPFVISDSVTVSGAPGAHAAITTTSGDGIVVNYGDVTLRNLVVLGTAAANNGIRNTGAQTLHVVNCFIGGFVNPNGQGRGIVSGSGILYAERVRIHKNAAGINVQFGDARITDSTLDDNTDGLFLSGPIRVDIANTAISGNYYGLYIATEVYTLDVTLNGCTVALNEVGLYSSPGSGASVVRLTNDAFFSNNTADIQNAANSTIYAYGNNSIQNVGSATLTAATLH